MADKVFKNIGIVDGGVRQDVANEKVPDTAWLLLENWEYRKDGKLACRRGQTNYNGTAIAGTMDNGIRFYNAGAATLKTLVSAFITGKTAIYSGNDGTGAFTEITANDLTANLPVNFAAFRNYVFMANGTDTLRFYTSGTTKGVCSYSDYDRKGKYITVADWRIWLAGDPSSPNLVHVSGTGFFTTHPSVDCTFPVYINVPGHENDLITGLAAHEDEVYVFRSRDVWRVAGNTERSFTMKRVISDTGAISQKAIVSTPYGIFFSDGETIWLYSPSNNELINAGKVLSDQIESGSLATASGGYYEALKRVYFSFKGSSTSSVNDECLIFDLLNEKAYSATGMGATAFVSNSRAGDNNRFYRLTSDTSGTQQGRLVRLDTGTQDNSANYTCVAKSKHFDITDGHVRKWLRELWFACSASDDTAPFTISVIIDRGARETTLPAISLFGFNRWGELVFGRDIYGGGDYQYGTAPAPHALNGNEFQIVFTKTSNLDLKLFKYKIEARVRPLRRR